MTKIKKPNLSLATYTIKGYHSSWVSALGGFFTLFVSIALLIVAVEFKNVLSSADMTISLAVLCSVLFLSVAAFMGGLILTKSIKKKDCVIFFENFIMVYEFRNLFKCGYRVLNYEEISEYRFRHDWNQRGSGRHLLACDFYNYGWLKIRDNADNEYKVPVNDIEKAKELLKLYTGKEETVHKTIKE